MTAPDTDHTLATLAGKSADGDLDAFEELVKTVHGRLAAFIMLLGVREADVSDIAQETYVALYQSIRRYDPAHPFVNWLRGIARNTVHRHYRSRHAQDSIADKFREYVRSRAASDEGQPSFWERARYETLRHCMQRLNDEQRTVVDMRYTKDKDSSDIAVSLGLQASSVRKTLTRARLALRRCIEGTAASA